MKVLFITSRNIISTCGELRLIKNRTNALLSYYGVETDFLVCRKKASGTNETPGENFELQAFTYNSKNLLGILKQWRRLYKAASERLEKEEYNAIIFSGYCPQFVISGLTKKYSDIMVIADFHGTYEELLEFSKADSIKGIIKKVAYPVLKRSEAREYGLSKGCFVASNALKDYLIEAYGEQSKMFFAVLCANNIALIDKSQYTENRRKYRGKYNISEDTILLVYSGGVSPWQCIEQSVNTFKQLQTKSKKKLKLLILTSKLDGVKKYQNDNIVIDSVLPNIVDQVLCAGDVAFMLREDYITNNVAFPNKFLEYVKSGMKIISTPYVYDTAKLISANQLGCIVKCPLEDDDVSRLLAYVECVETPTEGELALRNDILSGIGFESTLRRFSDALRDKEDLHHS